jgi:hypothetical protein
MLGFAAFSWLRRKPVAREPNLKRGGARNSPTVGEASGGVRASLSAPSDPLEALELDLDFEEIFAAEHGAVGQRSVAPEGIGSVFLARVTDALSPFGDHFDPNRLDLDPFAVEPTTRREAAETLADTASRLASESELEAAPERRTRGDREASVALDPRSSVEQENRANRRVAPRAFACTTNF